MRAMRFDMRYCGSGDRAAEEAIEGVPKGIPKKMCGAKRRGTLETCRKAAGFGTPHVGIGACTFHGGSSPYHIMKWVKHEAEKEWAKRGFPYREIDPYTALMEEVWRTAWLVHFAEKKVHEEGLQESTHEDYDGRKQGSKWWNVYRTEREHLIKAAKVCIDAGVAERHVALLESLGKRVADAMLGVAEGLRSELERGGVPSDVLDRLSAAAPRVIDVELVNMLPDSSEFGELEPELGQPDYEWEDDFELEDDEEFVFD